MIRNTPLVGQFRALHLVDSNLPSEEVLDEQNEADDTSSGKSPALDQDGEESNNGECLNGGGPQVMELLHESQDWGPGEQHWDSNYQDETRNTWSEPD